MRGTEGMNKHGAEPCGCGPGSRERGWDVGQELARPIRSRLSSWGWGKTLGCGEFATRERGDGAGPGVRHSLGLWQNAGNGHEVPC